MPTWYSKINGYTVMLRELTRHRHTRWVRAQYLFEARKEGVDNSKTALFRASCSGRCEKLCDDWEWKVTSDTLQGC